MGFIEDTAVTAKDFLDAAVRKTNETVEIQRLKVAVTRKGHELTTEFAELGRLYFDSVKQEADITEEAAPVIASIEEKMSEFAELKRKLSEARGQQICGECGRVNDADAVYCSTCGTKLSK